MDQQKVGLFLKQLRSEKNITQAELAELLGVSNRSISRWENGMTMPDFDLLIELAKYYDVEVGEIGTLLTGLLYSSRYIVKIKEAKMRLSNNLRRLK